MRRCLFSYLRILGAGHQRQDIIHSKSFQVIRHSIHSSVKSFSSSTSIFNCIPIIDEGLSLSSTKSEEAQQKELLFSRVGSLMDQNEYNKAILILKASQTRLDPHQILPIAQKLIDSRNFQHLKTVYSIYNPEILKHTGLLVTMLDATYLERDYTLFETLFDHYIKTTPYPTSYYFNLALKVFLRTAPHLSKQLLYQMMNSQYPNDENTIYEFLRVADRVCNFETIKFVTELIKRNPKEPIDDRAFGVLVDCYLRNGTGVEYDELMKFLKSIKMDECFEVRMSMFLHEITYEDLETAWSKFDRFKNEQVSTKNELHRLYECFYSRLSTRFDWENTSKYITKYRNDGFEMSQKLEIKAFSGMDDERLILEFLQSIKTEGRQLRPHHLECVWRSLVLLRPDFAHHTVNSFDTLIKKHREDQTWMIHLSPKSKIHKASSSVANSYNLEFDPRDSEVFLKQVKKCIAEKDDAKIIHILDGLTRDGIKVNLKTLMFTMKALSKMNSPEFYKIYQLIHESHPNPPIDVELIWLKHSLYRFKKREIGNSSIRGIRMVTEFETRNSFRLGFEAYNQLASHMIDLRSYDQAIEYLGKAKDALGKNAWHNMSAFVLLLKALLWKHDLRNFILLMKVILDEKHISISRYSMKRMHDYKKHILNNEKIDLEERQQFAKEFDEVMILIKNRYIKQHERFLKTLEEIMNVYEDWITATKN